MNFSVASVASEHFKTAAGWMIANSKVLSRGAMIGIVAFGVKTYIDAQERQEKFVSELGTKVRQEMARMSKAGTITVEYNGATYSGNVIEGVAIDRNSLAMSLIAAKTDRTNCFFTKVEATDNFDLPEKRKSLPVIYQPNADLKGLGCYRLDK